MTERSKHISSSFDAALYVLKNDVLMMSSLTDRNFQTAIKALLNRDSQLCNQVIAEDEEVDILEKQVDQDGVNLLLRFQPVASDMREVISAMKVSTNLERIADHAVTIARRAKHLNNRPPVREVQFLDLPYRLAVAILRDSIRAYADADYELAQTLKPKDRELDALTHDLSEKLVERATVDSELVPSLVTWTLSLLLTHLSGLGIMLRTSLRIRSGAIKPPTFVIPTAQRKKIDPMQAPALTIHPEVTVQGHLINFGVRKRAVFSVTGQIKFIAILMLR